MADPDRPDAGSDSGRRPRRGADADPEPGPDRTSLDRARALDAADPLSALRAEFVVADADLIYLDGNSLGRLPLATVERLDRAVREEWGAGLVRSWPDWIDLPTRIGDEIGTGLLQARPGEVVLADSTSVNLYKLAAAALEARPDRTVILTDDDNFPTDRYILQGLAESTGRTLRTIHTDLDAGLSTDAVRSAVDGDVALASFSHVAYRSGALADLAGVTAACHDAGALTLWDTSHSAGAVPVPLGPSHVDLAVGCTYKYLNGGPGAPAYLFVRRDLVGELRQPIWGWFGQRDQFGMAADYDPAPGIERFLSGTPPVPGMYAVREGVRGLVRAGVDALRAKSLALTGLLLDLADAWLTPLGFRVATPREPDRRGSHVTLRHPDAWRISQALIARKVVGDYRVPERLRLGVTPLTTSYVEVWEAMRQLRELVLAGEPENYPAEPGRIT